MKGSGQESAISPIIAEILMVALVCLATGVAYVFLFQLPNLGTIPVVAVDITKSGNVITLFHKNGDPLELGTFSVTVNGDQMPDGTVRLAGGTYPWSSGEQLVVTYSGTRAINDVKLIYTNPPGPVVLASAYFTGNTTPVTAITNGSIAVTSTPAGATIRLDTVDTGSVTPSTLANVTAGQHRIDVTLTGYYPANLTVPVTATSTVNANFTLVKETPVYARYPGFTVEAWVKWEVTPDPGIDSKRKWATIVVDGNSDATRRYQLEHDQYNTHFEFVAATSSSSRQVWSGTRPVINTWYHVVGIYNQTDPGDRLRIYVNGVKELSTSIDGGGLKASPNFYQVGGPDGIQWPGTSSMSRKFNGKISGLATYEEALSQAEILAHYQAGVP